MKTYLHLLNVICLILISSISYGQKTFQDGYIINKSNDTIKVQFYTSKKNISTPQVFKYKLPNKSEILSTEIIKVKEIGFEDGKKYRKEVVEIDKHFTKDLKKLSSSRALITEKESLFIEIIAEGEVTIAKYEEAEKKQFYYKNQFNEFVLLIHSQYLVKDKIMTNDTYRYQLKVLLDDANLSDNLFKKLDYRQNSIISLVKAYYEAKDKSIPKLDLVDEFEMKDLISIQLRPGLRMNSAKLNNVNNDDNFIDFGNHFSFRFGTEFEINHYSARNWSIMFEPIFQYYKSEADNETGEDFFIDYSSIEFALGVRHYILNKNETKIYSNAYFLYEMLVKKDAQLDILSLTPRTKLHPSIGFSFGVGFQFKEKYSLEFQYNFPRNIIHEQEALNTTYQGLSLIFGYKIF